MLRVDLTHRITAHLIKLAQQKEWENFKAFINLPTAISLDLDLPIMVDLEMFTLAQILIKERQDELLTLCAAKQKGWFLDLSTTYGLELAAHLLYNNRGDLYQRFTKITTTVNLNHKLSFINTTFFGLLALKYRLWDIQPLLLKHHGLVNLNYKIIPFPITQQQDPYVDFAGNECLVGIDPVWSLISNDAFIEFELVTKLNLIEGKEDKKSINFDLMATPANPKNPKVGLSTLVILLNRLLNINHTNEDEAKAEREFILSIMEANLENFAEINILMAMPIAIFIENLPTIKSLAQLKDKLKQDVDNFANGIEPLLLAEVNQTSRLLAIVKQLKTKQSYTCKIMDLMIQNKWNEILPILKDNHDKKIDLNYKIPFSFNWQNFRGATFAWYMFSEGTDEIINLILQQNGNKLDLYAKVENEDSLMFGMTIPLRLYLRGKKQLLMDLLEANDYQADINAMVLNPTHGLSGLTPAYFLLTDEDFNVLLEWLQKTGWALNLDAKPKDANFNFKELFFLKSDTLSFVSIQNLTAIQEEQLNDIYLITEGLFPNSNAKLNRMQLLSMAKEMQNYIQSLLIPYDIKAALREDKLNDENACTFMLQGSESAIKYFNELMMQLKHNCKCEIKSGTYIIRAEFNELEKLFTSEIFFKTLMDGASQYHLKNNPITKNKKVKKKKKKQKNKQNTNMSSTIIVNDTQSHTTSETELLNEPLPKTINKVEQALPAAETLKTMNIINEMLPTTAEITVAPQAIEQVNLQLHLAALTKLHQPVIIQGRNLVYDLAYYLHALSLIILLKEQTQDQNEYRQFKKLRTILRHGQHVLSLNELYAMINPLVVSLTQRPKVINQFKMQTSFFNTPETNLALLPSQNKLNSCSNLFNYLNMEQNADDFNTKLALINGIENDLPSIINDKSERDIKASALIAAYSIIGEMRKNDSHFHKIYKKIGHPQTKPNNGSESSNIKLFSKQRDKWYPRLKKESRGVQIENETIKSQLAKRKT